MGDKNNGIDGRHELANSMISTYPHALQSTALRPNPFNSLPPAFKYLLNQHKRTLHNCADCGVCINLDFNGLEQII